MSDITIDKDIPIPPRKGKRRNLLDPILKMEIGDSIGGLTAEEANRFAASARNHAARSPDPHKLIYRKEDDGTFRVWRVE